MKKFTSLSFMLIAALMMFASCSKDDDGAPALDLKLLEGEWTVTKTVYSDDGEETIDEESSEVYVFNADKSYSVSGFNEGTYTASGTKLTLTSGDQIKEFEIKELTANNLRLYTAVEMEFFGYNYVYSTTTFLSKAQ